MSTTRMIFCEKLKKDATSLSAPPFKGELGEKIFAHISAEAFDLWKKRQVMLINEYRLNLLDPKSKSFLREQMEDFLFNDKDVAPEGYVAPV